MKRIDETCRELKALKSLEMYEKNWKCWKMFELAVLDWCRNPTSFDMILAWRNMTCFDKILAEQNLMSFDKILEWGNLQWFYVLWRETLDIIRQVLKVMKALKVFIVLKALKVLIVLKGLWNESLSFIISSVFLKKSLCYIIILFHSTLKRSANIEKNLRKY